MSSSFKNAEKAHRRAHKERGQLSSRSKLGLLEKKKDHKHRARDYHIKQKRLKVLREKARDRNPDEFYFKMVNSKVKDGQHFQKNIAKAPAKKEKVRSLCVDLFQVETERMRLRKEIEEFHVSLSLMPGVPDHPQRKHTVFLETVEEAREYNSSAEKRAEYFGTHPLLLTNTANRLRTEQLASAEIPALGRRIRKKGTQHYKAKVKAIEEAKVRLRALEQEYERLTAAKNDLSFKNRKKRKVLRSKRV